MSIGANLISLVITNGDAAHAAQVDILAGAIFHPDTQYAVFRNVDRIAAAIAAVPTVVVIVVVVVVIIISAANGGSAEGIRSTDADSEGPAANRSIRGVQNHGLSSGQPDAFYVSSRSAVTSLRELATQDRGRGIPAE